MAIKYKVVSGAFEQITNSISRAIQTACDCGFDKEAFIFMIDTQSSEQIKFAYVWCSVFYVAKTASSDFKETASFLKWPYSVRFS